MRKIVLKTVLSLVLVLFIAVSATCIPAEAADSTSKIYYNIDFSAAVLKSRINQKVSGDCGVVSMATTEAYLHGATSSADKTAVYNAVLSANKDDNWAYWGNLGYTRLYSINWEAVYTQISKGYPCLIHRDTSDGEHWAVVAGYKGSTTKLDANSFIVVDVYHGSNLQDIYTSKAWAKDGSINGYAYRKNGIAITALSGIRFAINHPSLIHKQGEGHGVYGNVVSNANLTNVQVTVTHLTSGTVVYNKKINPGAKKYLLYNLDAEMTFAKWPVGEYYYTVLAQTASTSNIYNRYFRISGTYPTTDPTPVYTISYNANGGMGTMAPSTHKINTSFVLTTNGFTRSGYSFAGWNCRRSDGKWIATDSHWHTESELSTLGLGKFLYEDKRTGVVSGWWLREGTTMAKEFTFYAVWTKDSDKGDVNEDGDVNNVDAALVLKYDAGVIDEDGLTLINADVNGDGNVNNLDAAKICKYDAGLIEGL